jgi:hypothetical protein
MRLRKGEAIAGQVSFEQHQRDLNVRFLYELETYAVNGTQVTSGYGLYKV